MAECTYKTNIANISAIRSYIVLQALCDESCDLATQLGSRKLFKKFILGDFRQ